MLTLEKPIQTRPKTVQMPLTRLEQQFNSMSPASMEKYFSNEKFRCGAIRTCMQEPESKLRDLARLMLDVSEHELGELDIAAVAQLFFVRGMTFSLNNICSLVSRRAQEPNVDYLFDKQVFVHTDRNVSYFLVHDENNNVALATVTRHQDRFSAKLTLLTEAPLFEGEPISMLLRHPQENLLWFARPRPAQGSAAENIEALLLRDTSGYRWIIEKSAAKADAWPEAELLRTKVEAALKNWAPKAVGLAVWESQNWITVSENPLLGLSEYAVHHRSTAVEEIMTNGLMFSAEELAWIMITAKPKGLVFPGAKKPHLLVCSDGLAFHIVLDWRKSGERCIAVHSAETPDFRECEHLLLKVPGINDCWEIGAAAMV